MFELFTMMLGSLKPGAQLIVLLPYVGSIALSIAAYVLQGIALAQLSRATGKGRVWMAWVPYASLYLLGLLADTYTDNRMTTDADRADPFYRPSDLRRRMLGYGLGCGITGAVSSVAALLFIMGGAVSFFMILGLLVGGDPPTEVPPFAAELFLISGLTAFVAGIFSLVFAVLFLLAFCPALCRVLTALKAPLPALWVALGFFFPLIHALLLWVYTRRASDPASAFAPPPEPTHAAETADNVERSLL